MRRIPRRLQPSGGGSTHDLGGTLPAATRSLAAAGGRDGSVPSTSASCSAPTPAGVAGPAAATAAAAGGRGVCSPFGLPWCGCGLPCPADHGGCRGAPPPPLPRYGRCWCQWGFQYEVKGVMEHDRRHLPWQWDAQMSWGGAWCTSPWWEHVLGKGGGGGGATRWCRVCVRAGICSSVLCTNADAVVVVSEGGTCSRLVHLRQKM